ncbi:hypothetical protein Riv7116_1586 [Rivularia sp. PCC 7116]|uniref:hypothetical protein n=1 Tax=Rivularia sp. PCC 7116 TaxID=373994 RepID=UPI00029F2C75|nr:hypothetical protein [Rivularia sp. PCC 7116]AFY54144.1 hypothetical protein Riv7116_1586 [Rivularia sp. PCC 7116]
MREFLAYEQGFPYFYLFAYLILGLALIKSGKKRLNYNQLIDEDKFDSNMILGGYYVKCGE